MDLSLKKLKEAVSIREQIETLEERLNSLFGSSRQASSSSSGAGSGTGGTSATAGGAKPDGRRRPMSPATRAKLAAAARARWARTNSGSGGASTGSTKSSTGGSKSAKSRGTKRRGGISPEGRRRLSEMMRARWAARRKVK